MDLDLDFCDSYQGKSRQSEKSHKQTEFTHFPGDIPCMQWV